MFYKKNDNIYQGKGKIKLTLILEVIMIKGTF